MEAECNGIGALCIELVHSKSVTIHVHVLPITPGTSLSKDVTALKFFFFKNLAL